MTTQFIKLGFLGGLGMTELIIIGLVVLLLFGGKKIPQLMKGLGEGIKSFRDARKDVDTELSEVKDEFKK